MKGMWAIPFDENGNMIENQFIQMQAAINQMTQEVVYFKGNVVIPLDMWEQVAFDNEVVDAIDVAWRKVEPKPAKEEREYGELYNWLLSRFEREM